MGIFPYNTNIYQKITSTLAALSSIIILIIIARASYLPELLQSMTGLITARVFIGINLLRVLLLWMITFAIINQNTKTRSLLTLSFLVETVAMVMNLFMLRLPTSPIWLISSIGPVFVVILTYILWTKCALWGKLPGEQIGARVYETDEYYTENSSLSKPYDIETMRDNQQKLGHMRAKITPYSVTDVYPQHKESSSFSKILLIVIVLGLTGYYTFKFSSVISSEIKYFLGEIGLFPALQKKRTRKLVKRFKVKPKTTLRNEVYMKNPAKTRLAKKFSNRVHSKKILKKKTTQYELGHAYLARKKYKMAIQAFTKALQENAPKYRNMLTHYFLATVYEKNLLDRKNALKHWLILKKLPSHNVKYQINFPKRAVGEVNRLQRRPKVR